MVLINASASYVCIGIKIVMNIEKQNCYEYGIE